MSRRLRDLHRDFRPYAQALYQVAREYNLKPRITSTFRSEREQRRLYEAYLKGRSRLPAAQPGISMHNFGLAFDMVTRDNHWLGQVWESWGGTWGGRFRDPVHFSAPR